jgi:phasin
MHNKPAYIGGRKPQEQAMTDKMKFDLPNIEVPQAVREFAEKGVQQAKDNYTKFKAAADQTAGVFEDSYATASKGATEFNVKALDALRTNVNAAFDYTRELFASKTLAEAVELSSAHVRKQFETLSEQAKDLTAVAQKVAAEASEPIKAGVSKTFQ